MRPRSIAAVLDRAPELERFLPQVDRLLALRAAIRDVVPRELADVVTVVGAQEHEVSILADNAAAAAKLRMLEPALVRACRAQAPQVAAVRVRVRGTQPPPTRAARAKRAKLNPGPAEALATLAETLPASPLQDAVARLSRRGRDG